MSTRSRRTKPSRKTRRKADVAAFKRVAKRIGKLDHGGYRLWIIQVGSASYSPGPELGTLLERVGE